MRTLMLNNRKVIDAVVSIERHGCDSFFISAVWEDCGENLNDDELDALTDKAQDYICEEVMETLGYWPD